MSQKLKFPGAPVYFNGQNYIVPSLAFQDFKESYDFLTAVPDVDGSKIFEYFEALVPIIGKAVRRNYPEVTDADLAGWLDMNTLPLAVKAVQAASGMTPVSEGE